MLLIPLVATLALQDGLDQMVEQLETQRQTLGVPGMAIAVVRDGEVILSRGFGDATDETIFAAASTTKAFTATLAAMLADEGLLDWDDPVRRHVPEFRLADPVADEQVVIRDLLCHRIGFASMSLLYYGNDVTSREILDTAVQAELLYPFRQRFNYSNVSFLAAGEAVGRAGGSSWHVMVEKLLFEPLGMDTATTTASPIAPAVAVNASARDLARWIQFQLGRGVIDGKRFVSESAHAETWKPHITVDGDVEYGLGWFLRTWQGRRVVEHAGGIDRYTAEIALMPEENLGFVLLLNRFGSPLQDTSRDIVFGSLLGVGTPAPAPRRRHDDETPAPGDLPDAVEIMRKVLAARGAEAAAKITSLRLDGTVRFPHLGLDGTVSILAGANGDFSEVFDLGRFGATRRTLAGEMQHPFTWLRDWSTVFEDMAVTGRTEVDGEPALEMRLNAERTLLISERTWLPLGARTLLRSAVGMSVPAEIRFDDWRDVDGVKMPFVVEISNPFSGTMLLTYQNALSE